MTSVNKWRRNYASGLYQDMGARRLGSSVMKTIAFEIAEQLTVADQRKPPWHTDWYAGYHGGWGRWGSTRIS
jgi:hypothetical protein